MIPVSFGGCAGWYHPAAGARGVVLVSPEGFEELCSRRAMRELADLLADAGVPTLRFDLRGVADSVDLASDQEGLEAWAADLDGAVKWLRERAGVREVGLAGLRLGAALAARYGAERGGLAFLALLEPVLSGKGYLRELKAMARLFGGDAPPPSDSAQGDEFTVAGFPVSASLREGLATLDLLELSAKPADRTLLVLSGPSRQREGFRATLANLGSRVEVQTFEGYDALMCDPTASQVPHATLARVVEWIAPSKPEAGARVPAPEPHLEGPGWREERVLFGAHRNLAGVLCGPASSERPRRAVLFVNAGAIPHAGWARMHVDFARSLAPGGVLSLRMDLAEIGDSVAGRRERGRTLYGVEARGDIAVAVDLLHERGVREITVLGACSGAHQAFHTAVEDRRITGLVLVNQLCFVWGPAYAMQLAAWRATKATDVVTRRGRADARGAVRDLWTAGALRLAKSIARPMLRRAQVLSVAFTRGDPVANCFARLSRRGVKVRLVYSAGDPGLEELARYMGPDGRDACALPGVSKHILAGADHVLTQARARWELQAILRDALAEPHIATGDAVAEIPAARERRMGSPQTTVSVPDPSQASAG